MEASALSSRCPANSSSITKLRKSPFPQPPQTTTPSHTSTNTIKNASKMPQNTTSAHNTITAPQSLAGPYSSLLPPPPGAHDSLLQSCYPSYNSSDVVGGTYSAAAAYNNYYTYHASMADPYFPFVTSQHLGKVRTLTSAHLSVKGSAGAYHPYALSRGTGAGTCQRANDVTQAPSCVGEHNQLFSTF